MRHLTTTELTAISGGTGGCYTPPPPCTPTPPACTPTKKAKGNNGFGNGANDGVPGKSGFTDATR
ncbi:MAG TPA: hypothetical protein VFO80_02660 [Sphingomonas sp.]|nr:hypothetical protein [Sphingomonas sp.]